MFEKLQKDFLAAMFNEKKRHQAFFCETDESVYLLINGSFFCKMPKNACYVRPDENLKHIQPEVLEKMIQLESAEIITPDCIRKTTDKNISVSVFKTRNGEEVWLNEKFVKYFTDNKSLPIIFYKTPGSVDRSPVQVYSGSTCIGCILPIYHK